jgi:hypothetical protein
VAYETFERSSVRVEDPMLSVRPDGRITLNAAASRLFQAAGVKAVRILWDKIRCGIALQGVSKGDKNSYTVSFSRGRSASITPKAFLTYIGWTSTKLQTVPARWEPKQKLLEAELPSKFVRKHEQNGTDREANTGM